MTAKEYLQQYDNAVRIARLLKREYEKELDLIDNVRSALGGDGQPRSGSVSKPVEETAIRLADKALAWKQAELDAIRIRQEVFDVIREVPGEKGDVLYERYINLKSWSEVARSVGFSKSRTHDLHNEALKFLKVRTQSDTLL